MATVKTENETSFATCWMAANALLMDAIADPSSPAVFEAAHAEAIRAIGKSYTASASRMGTKQRRVGWDEGSVEWEMGQSLARLITDVAKENGYTIR